MLENLAGHVPLIHALTGNNKKNFFLKICGRNNSKGIQANSSGSATDTTGNHNNEHGMPAQSDANLNLSLV